MLTFKQLTEQPAGKGSGDIYARSQALVHLKDRVDTAMKDDQIKIVGAYSYGNDYFVHTKIRSGVVDLWYDTVIKLEYHDNVKGKTFSDYYVKIFSNMPSFVYYYNYVNHQENGTIDFLANKLPNIFYDQPPKTRNPDERMGFEKSLMFTLFYLIKTKLHWVGNLAKKSKRLTNTSLIYNKVGSFELIMNKRSELIRSGKTLKEEGSFKKVLRKTFNKNSGFNSPKKPAVQNIQKKSIQKNTPRKAKRPKRGR